MKARAISSLCFGVFVIDTTVIFFSICAKSNIFISFCSLWDNSSNLSSSLKLEIKRIQGLKFITTFFDNPEEAFLKENFGKILHIKPI